jgi:hypothetical protein
VPGHFTTLWKSRSTSTPPGQLARDAAEYYYSARAESVKYLIKPIINQNYIQEVIQSRLKSECLLSFSTESFVFQFPIQIHEK